MITRFEDACDSGGVATATSAGAAAVAAGTTYRPDVWPRDQLLLFGPPAGALATERLADALAERELLAGAIERLAELFGDRFVGASVLAAGHALGFAGALGACADGETRALGAAASISSANGCFANGIVASTCAASFSNTCVASIGGVTSFAYGDVFAGAGRGNTGASARTGASVARPRGAVCFEPLDAAFAVCFALDGAPCFAEEPHVGAPTTPVEGVERGDFFDPHVGAVTLGVNVAGIAAIARGLANGITAPSRVSGAAIGACDPVGAGAFAPRA